MLKLRLNPDQNAGNTLSINAKNACCDGVNNVCQYAIAYTKTNTISAITIQENGVNKTLSFTAVTGAANVKAALETALEGAGYFEDGNGTVGIVCADGASNITIDITGEIKVVSVTQSGGTTTATEKCTVTGACSYEYTTYPGVSGSAFVVNGVSATLGDLTFATASAANVKSALEGAANWPSGAVATVVKNATTSKFEITITLADVDTHFSLDGVYFVALGCDPVYSA